MNIFRFIVWRRPLIPSSLMLMLALSLIVGLLPQGFPGGPTLAGATPVANGNLAGADALGRELPRDGQVRAETSGKYVGIFYFLWMGTHGTSGPFDITSILANNPNAAASASMPPWGPEQGWHFWGKPLYDYYLSDDAWVLRKHVQLLTDAGIDFLVFDATNAFTYKTVYDKLFQILDEQQAKGFKVPKIAFYTNSSSGTTITSIYNDVYAPNRYPNLWFNWKGKPLIIGDPTQVSSTIQNFFTFRLNQWPNEGQKTNGFPWIEFQRPQRVFYNNLGEKEVINVSVAQHASTISMSDTPMYGYGNNWGRSFHNGANDFTPGATNYGYNIAEQWDFALAQDPQIVFITGWNEWVAQRQPGNASRPIQFVDLATQEFSRDIEPMSGGYGDDYYLQMIGYIRKFKGMSAQPAPSAGKTITINTDFSQWTNVTPEYRDYTGDTVARSNPGWGTLTLTNNTGRNDLDTMKVARDNSNVYFYAKTKDPLTAYTGAKWMRLLIDADGNPKNGWNGFDYIVNRTGTTATTAALEQSTGGWSWTPAGTVSYKASGSELHLAIPRSALGLSSLTTPITLRFKWSDNMQTDGDAMDFYVNGDAAPDGRLAYVYTEAPGLPAAPMNLAASGGSGQASLSWSPIGGAASYNVKRATAPGGPYATVSTAGSVTSASYTDTAVTNGTAYYYVVTAVNASGESQPSAEASATPIAYVSVKNWNFNTGGNLEGWSMVNQATGSVAGGDLTVTSSGGDPFLHSPDNLAITNPSVNRYVRVRMKNNTGGTTAQVYFTTTSDTSWSEPKSKAFTITPNSGYVDYVVDMSTVAGWSGTIKQIRLDPLTVSGTANIDYIRITNGGGASYDSVAGFGSTQGANQWSYKYTANGTTYSNMTWSAANNWWSGSDAIVAAGWMHPNNAAMAARAWTAPASGTVNVSGSAAKASTAANGNGVNVKIMKNGTQVWPASGWQFIAGTNTTGYAFNFNTAVNAGDVLYFLLDGNGEHSYDTTNYSATIVYP
ncbi:hypothetical protein [Paenibacillus sacheonensis]|uniref:Fibronectin type-III domain-containing protein n=1 Tax=Paenibacillus sacheonensis TaxID=742054 RepID=A0A7X4YWG5_9BACL|nr:hypothetical protein [Paenibacillus sacheonensis]MBM7568921.1 hypothetical protein [Paenibacillus sacheonensis]NBC72704.1 hypothetical protein [Paenibacillus sacheonensis]